MQRCVMALVTCLLAVGCDDGASGETGPQDGAPDATQADGGVTDQGVADGAAPDQFLPGTLVLNELQASNRATVADEAGGFPDWIELHNPGADEVSLLGWTITDDPTGAARVFLSGDLVVPAGGYLVLFADDDPEEGPNHLPFKLSAGGDHVGLYGPLGERADQIDFGPQVTDQSLARIPDASGPWQVVPTPTPGARNEAGQPPPDPTDAVFADDALRVVSIEIAPDDFDTLRQQARGGLDFNGADCLDAPWGSPYTWFEARVTVDGQTYDGAGIRKKGFFGSVSESRPSFKIRFDKFVDGQLHQGLSRLTLNNNRQDPSRLRTCLAYKVFADNGLPAPRCNFAQVFVNGRDFGVFTHVESIKRPFLARHFADPSGLLYEGTLSDFRPEYQGTFEQKVDEDTPNFTAVQAVADAAAGPDDGLLDRLGAVIDLDQFFTFWAVEVAVAHWDGYAGNTNNFWVYADPESERLHFLPWGPDATFAPPRLLFEGVPGPRSVLASGYLAYRLYHHPEGQARYLAALDEVLARWDVAAMQAQVDRWAALVDPAVADWNRAGFTEGVQQVRGFVAQQPRAIARERGDGAAEWPVPLRQSLCRVELGDLDVRFDTTWGTWPTDDAFQTGTGTFSGTLRGQALEAQRVGAAAGPTGDGPAALVLPAFLGAEELVFVYLLFDPRAAAPGRIPLWGNTDCTLNVLDLQTGESDFLASCPQGTLVFEAASRQRGAPVQGRLEATLFGAP